MSTRSASSSYRTSPHVVIRSVGRGRYVAWNRFRPSVVVLNGPGVSLLERLRGRASGPSDASAEELDALASHRLVYEGDVDPSPEDFRRSVDEAFQTVEKTGAELLEQRKEYGNLYFTNSVCNLHCDYCIQKHVLDAYKANVGPLPFAPRSGRWPVVERVIDQYLERKTPGEKALVTFNGGEILLEWELIRRIVEYIARRHPQHRVTYNMNSNMTLMTAEIAKFMNRHGFGVFMSIDGYAQTHNRSRRYSRGQGSFEDVIRGWEIFNRHNRKHRIVGFQGTIEYADGFDAERLFAMSRYGFVNARMAPNLLGVSVEEGKKKAELEARLFKMSKGRKLQFSDTYFLNMGKLLNRKETGFFFNCQGLSSYPARSISVDLSTMRATQLCPYVPAVSIPLAEVENDIYHPKLVARANAYIRARLDALQAACGGCELVGICRGSCILMGLDADNRINEAACAYQKTLWDEFVHHAHGRMKANPPSKRRAKPARARPATVKRRRGRASP